MPQAKQALSCLSVCRSMWLPAQRRSSLSLCRSLIDSFPGGAQHPHNKLIVPLSTPAAHCHVHVHCAKEEIVLRPANNKQCLRGWCKHPLHPCPSFIHPIPNEDDDVGTIAIVSHCGTCSILMIIVWRIDHWSWKPWSRNLLIDWPMTTNDYTTYWSWDLIMYYYFCLLIYPRHCTISHSTTALTSRFKISIDSCTTWSTHLFRKYICGCPVSPKPNQPSILINSPQNSQITCNFADYNMCI